MKEVVDDLNSVHEALAAALRVFAQRGRAIRESRNAALPAPAPSSEALADRSVEATPVLPDRIDEGDVSANVALPG